MEQTDAPVADVTSSLAAEPAQSAEAPTPVEAPPAGCLSLELGLYLLLWTLAAGLRLWDLGLPLLSADESRRALSAWQLTRGQTADLAPGPTLLYATGALFFLFSANDLAARLVPALAGLTLVFWPYLLRERLGREPALFATFLLATSPTLVHVGRSLNGEGPALALLALLGFSWLRFTADGDRRYLTLAGAAGGLLLGCGPAAFALLGPAILACALALAAWRRLPAGLERAPGLWRAWVAPAGATLVLVATGLFSQPQGLQRGVIDALALWGRSFLEGEGRAWLSASTSLPAYEPAAVAAALVAVAFWRSADDWARLALVWATCALLFAGLAAGASASGLSFVVFPLCLAGGWAVSALWRRGRQRLSTGEAALFLATTVPVVWLFGIVAGHLSLPGAVVPQGVVAVPLAILWLAAALWSYWRGPSTAAWGTTLLAAVVLAAFAFHAGVAVAQGDPLAPGEVLMRRAPAADLRHLLTEIDRHSAVFSTPGRRDLRIHVDASLRFPLAWYLRDYSRVAYDGPAAQPTLAIVPAEAEPPPGNYLWQRYTLDEVIRSAPRGPGELWRWYLYRDATVGTVGREVRLYVAAQASR